MQQFDYHVPKQGNTNQLYSMQIFLGGSLGPFIMHSNLNSFQQPQYGDIIKSLPQPLPIPVTDNLPKDMEDEEEQEEEEKEVSFLCWFCCKANFCIRMFLKSGKNLVSHSHKITYYCLS